MGAIYKKKPKLVMTLLARNEGDIIRKNIEFHLSHGVDFIIATDNASTDNTRDILAEYENKGKLHLIDEPSRDMSQSKWNNRMTEIAINNYKADIIFHCDADEFWLPKNGDLKSEIYNSSADVLIVNMINVLLEDRGGIESFPEDTKYAVVNPIETENWREDSKKNNFYFFKYPPKVIFKTQKGLLKVSYGNHSIINEKETINTKKSENINIYHFPLRNKKRFFNKCIKFGKATEKNLLLKKNQSWHIRRWFDAYKLGKLDEEYNKLTISKEKAMEMQRVGMIESFNFQNFLNRSMNKDWKYFIPRFEYEKEFQDITWPWVGHRYFAYDLVRNIKPKKIVELGTHKGTSFFSFCQAVKDEALDTEINAIDTWQGDKHAGFYGDDIYKFVQKIVNKLYSNVKIKLIRKTFDDAIFEFKDESIDILHIDGLHTYEAVKHDFENWLVKVKKNGIVLFHDIKVGESDFGVCKLWEELKQKYQTIEFHHSFGLGVLFKNKGDNSNKITRLQKELQMHYYYIYERMKNEKINNSINSIKNKDVQLKQKENEIKSKENEIKSKENEIKSKDGLIANQNKTLEAFGKLNNTLLGRTNWAVHNPKKFLKKYFEKANWAVRNPWKFIKKYFVSKLIKFWQKIVIIGGKIKWTMCNPKKFLKKYNTKIKHLSREHAYHLKNEGLVKSTKRTINYLIFGKGTLDKLPENKKEQVESYHERVKNFEKYLNRKGYKGIKKIISNFKYNPKISIIVPVYNVSKIWLEKCIDSVINQYYTNWELCLQDDASTKEETLKCLKSYENKDRRIKIGYSKKNQNISLASNEALKLATGDYIGLLDNDDEITPDALYEVVKILNKNKESDFIYSDEDKIDMNGVYCDPHFKSDYNSDLLLSQNYICHFSVIRKELIEKIGGFRASYEGSQDHDLFLRLVEKTKKIYHIPKVLYHWRKIPGSTAAEYGSKNYAWERGRKAVEDALERTNIDGKAELGEFPGSYHLVRNLKNEPLISIIIPFKDYPELLDYSIGSVLKKSTYKNFEIIGISNNSEQKETFKKIEYYKKLDSRVHFYEYNVPFNYSKINNFAAKKSRGEHLVLMNNDIKVITSDWIEQLLQHSQRKEVGAVGAKLYYPDDTVQHAGVIIKLGGIAGHSHKFFRRESPGYFGRLKVIHDVSAVTAALLMVKKEIYNQMNGLDENLEVAFNDVDFCLRLREQGYLNVFTPYCEMYHYESKSRGNEDTKEKMERFKKEINYIKKKHRKIFLEFACDPYYNPNLTINRRDFSLKKSHQKVI